MRKHVRLPVIALLLALVLLVGSLPLSFAEPVERVLIEYMPGKGAMLRNTVLGAGGEIHYEFDRINAMAVTVTARWANRLAKDPNVVSIELDAKRYPAADPLPVGDPYVEQVVPFGVERVQAPLAWAEGATGEGVTVCIIDTGLYVAHEDIDDDYVLGGTSQDPDSEWDQDGDGHGTHVAGTVSAADNEVGVIGVSPGKVTLYMVKIFGEDGLSTNASNLMAAAFTCAENGANIISMSLAGSAGPNPERKAFDALYNEEGILSVAAASNDGNRMRVFPASYDSVISVAATDINNKVAFFSNQNRWVELAAPGVGVLSTISYVAVAGVTVEGVFYPGSHIEYSPYTPAGGVGGPLVDGGLCDASGDWSGAVVLCERSAITGWMLNVKAGGGVAVLRYNNEPIDYLYTFGAEGDYLPTIFISQETGQFLVANKLGSLGLVEDYEPVEGSGYLSWYGTSMATPHVSGVAALLWSANPDWTNVQIREAMDMTALDLGEPGRDIAYGYGLVQAYDALQYLLNMGPD